MKIEDYTYEEVQGAINKSTSKKEVMINLGIPVNNGNYRRIDMIAGQYGLTLPVYVFDAKRMPSNRTRMADDEFFTKDVIRSGPSIRKRLVNLGVEDICSECGQEPIWNGKPLTLEVDHIDGNKYNNLLENLRILCGHCHSQTPTYSNRRGKVYSSCTVCKIQIPKTRKYCSDHRPPPSENGSKVIIDYPPVEDIVSRIKELGGWSATERFYGIGQNSLRKHLKRNGIDPKEIEYVRRIHT